LENSEKHTTCYWKGEANYYNVKVEEMKNEDAAWCYPETKEEAKNIENYIAFWQDVEVIE
jgi:uncharacterized protein (DUF427 family)